MSLTRELPRYQSHHKQVHALKIAHLNANPRGVELHFEDQRYAPHQVPYAWCGKHNVNGLTASGGYFVVYADGYESFSPGPAFEADYTLISGGEA